MKTDSSLKKVSAWLYQKLKPVKQVFESDLERAIRQLCLRSEPRHAVC